VSDLKDPRVLFAAERTLLAWNRTSLALIAFGFLIERSALFLDAVSPGQIKHGSDVMTFWIGLAFIAVGVFAAVYSSRQYSLVLKTLQAVEFPDNYAPRWGLGVNGLVALLGSMLILALFMGLN
tara:strand:- start:37794 stop:38165 length:372 start_codon:yes stop_codon:yes gene_type:complete